MDPIPDGVWRSFWCKLAATATMGSLTSQVAACMTARFRRPCWGKNYGIGDGDVEIPNLAKRIPHKNRVPVALNDI